MQHILVAYSWSVNNIGDMAITPGLLVLLARIVPDTRVTVLSNLAAGTDDFRTSQRWFAGNFPGVALLPNPFLPPQGSAAPRLAQLAERAFGADTTAFEQGCLSPERSREIIDWTLDRLPALVADALGGLHAEFAACLATVDAVIYNSGTTFNFGRGEPFAPTHTGDATGKRSFWDITLVRSMPLVVARSRGIPFAINGQSFEALDYPADGFFRELFRTARFVAVRDPDSLAYLAGKGIGDGNLRYGPDSTFFFPKEDTVWAGTFLAANGLAGTRFAALVIRTSVQGYITAQREQAHMAVLREFICQWVARTGQPVLLCPEVRIEIEVMRTQIYEKLPEAVRQRCVMQDEFWTTAQATAVYRAAGLVMSMEMHSIILALAVGTPVLHPQFAEAGRKAAMLAELGLGRWTFDIDHVAPYELLAAALEIERDLPSCTQAISRAMQRVAALAETNIRELALAAAAG